MTQRWSTHSISLILLLSLLTSFDPADAAAQSQGVVGDIQQLRGVLTAESEGKKQPIQIGATVSVGDMIATDHSGHAEIIFRDGVRVMLGPATDLTIRSYLPDPKTRIVGVFDLFNGSVKVDVPNEVTHSLAFETFTAAVYGKSGTWYLVAKAESTIIAVDSGYVIAQQLKADGTSNAPKIEAKAPGGLRIPGVWIGPPSVITEREAVEYKTQLN